MSAGVRKGSIHPTALTYSGGMAFSDEQSCLATKSGCFAIIASVIVLRTKPVVHAEANDLLGDTLVDALSFMQNFAGNALL
jgi:hypothetical protein